MFTKLKFFYAVTALTIVECFALSQGFDGKGLILTLSLIAGLGGFELGKIKGRKNE